MSFATPVFLWVFMPAVLLLYWVLPRSFRNLLIAVASLAFYTYGAGSFVVVLLGCIAANYAAGLALDHPRLTARGRNLVLFATVAGDLGVLAYWKYGGFLAQQVANVGQLFGGPSREIVGVALPIGISFFTFHHMSYVIDVWRRTRPALRHPVDFVTYIAMFPQLVAGPIVRFHEIADQLPQRDQNRAADFAAGFPRFALGLAKKTLVADTIAPVAQSVFSLSPSELTTPAAWLGVTAYTLQIYFDFSGYSDMAIGLGRMFGFRLPENFARPYSAISITDFWRRWHMSLSRWFRDYLYIPLGGNRGGGAKTYRNLAIVFLLTGLWHGAAWTFICWGAYHGTLLIIEKRTGVGKADGEVPWWWRARTFILVMVGWVFFRAHDIGQALGILRAMFWPMGHGLPSDVDVALSDQRLITMALALTVVLLPRTFVFGRVLEFGRGTAASLGRAAVVCAAAPYAAVVVAAGTFSPFLYYQF